jgi:acetyl esterase
VTPLSNPRIAAAVARLMQAGTAAALAASNRHKKIFPEIPGNTEHITIPTSIAPAPAVVYRPAKQEPPPPVHVNFHGGGFIMPGIQFDDPLCRYLAAEAGIVVVNVDYVLAPQHRFPEPPKQAYEAVCWAAGHGTELGWDGTRLTVGGQSAGAGLAAAVARQALERGGPPIALQVLNYPPIDLVTPAGDKPSSIANPLIKPWMGDVFDNVYIPDPAMRTDRLASPAHPGDTADLTGIAPALVITAEYDRLRNEGERYARRLHDAGALVEHYDVPRADHAYDRADTERTRQAYGLMARCIREATRGH